MTKRFGGGGLMRLIVAGFFFLGLVLLAVFTHHTTTVVRRIPAQRPCIAVANIPSLDYNGLYCYTPAADYPAPLPTTRRAANANR